jgi:putative phage-type endonuclease
MTFHGVALPALTRDEWLAERRNGLGASDVPALLGLSPYSTPWQVWVSKVTDAPEVVGTEPMRWGQVLERSILNEWTGRENYLAGPLGQAWQHPQHEWARCTPDGVLLAAAPFMDPGLSVDLWYEAEPWAVVEVKNVRSGADEWDRGETVPPYIVAQVQWQMFVTGLERGFVVALIGGNRLHVHELAADPAVHAEMFRVARDWWASHVVAGEPPQVEAADNALLASLWPTSVEKAVEVDPELIVELRAARAAAKVAEARKDEAEARLKAALGDADTAVCDGRVAATWRTQSSTRVDVSRLRAAEPEVARRFTTTSTIRVLRPKEDK